MQIVNCKEFNTTLSYELVSFLYTYYFVDFFTCLDSDRKFLVKIREGAFIQDVFFPSYLLLFPSQGIFNIVKCCVHFYVLSYIICMAHTSFHSVRFL